jgi:spermidine/putrescine transport system substrate-binding protein
MENAKLWQNFIMDPENAALISDFAKYSNGILGSDTYMKQLDPDFADSPEFKIPAGLEPEFVPPCSKEVTDKYNKIWTALKK